MILPLILVALPVMGAGGIFSPVAGGGLTVIALPMNIAKVIPYTYGIAWTPEIVQLFVLLIPTLFLSVALGKRLLKNVPLRTFELLQSGIMAVGAAKLLFFP